MNDVEREPANAEDVESSAPALASTSAPVANAPPTNNVPSTTLDDFGLTIEEISAPTARPVLPLNAVEGQRKLVCDRLERTKQDINSGKVQKGPSDYRRDGGIFKVVPKLGNVPLLPVAANGKRQGIPAGKTLKEVAATIDRIKQAVEAGALDEHFPDAMRRREKAIQNKLNSQKRNKSARIGNTTEEGA
ncbi:hypothetical protein [Paracraurococcus lichenis]|uniref:Uncharacterized protein n=1 Tax=Paracraurococcus lichenis TaxID=3064888 RepID=A0ABT9E4V7_9PROT|nr:hypothetical protein [Paracraurococcus sp. LOR1-02]MDO9711030.1 hypothetical protein [Paracraurococcus sp. LOR1-02]